MQQRHCLGILRQVLSLPTAPFVEQHVVAFIRKFVAKRSALSLKQDAVGNLLIRYRHGGVRVKRPICLSAHMDHPGFAADRMTAPDCVRAIWRGGVFPEYVKNARVRFYSDGRWVRGKVTDIVTAKRGTRTVVKTAVIKVGASVDPGSPGMWDFPDPEIRGGRVHARACDDLAGVAAMLASLDDLTRRRADGDAYFLFTRAEEVGFVGAMAACKLETIPKRCVVIAVENSSERSNARMGDGPILRVGDRATTFTSAATSFCELVAKDLAARKKSFNYQRRLMDGGMCESSAFCELGYEATGVCIALGHYHNMNTKTGKLAPEHVDLQDVVNLATWFSELVTSDRRYTGRDQDLLARLNRLQKEYNPTLKRSAKKVCLER